MIRRLWLRWRWTALAVALFGYPGAETWAGLDVRVFGTHPAGECPLHGTRDGCPCTDPP